MPATWSFNESNPSDVATEVTQVEHFDNERLRLESSLVREVIQNSMDASDKSGPVRVCFRIRDLTEIGPGKVRILRRILEPIEPHLEACQVPIPNDNDVRLLCIEDFNTTGLTGRFDKKDGDNFSNFWRIMGKSEKSHGKGGRRGLGKLVFAASSKLNTFFGVTCRRGDDGLFAMGHVILRNHTIDDVEYKPHGVWHDGRTEDKKELQLPTNDKTDLYNLQYISSFKRTVETGFTVLIPYLKDSITDQNIIDSVLKNYYFSILSNELVVTVGDTQIDSISYESVYQRSHNVRNTIPLNFISSVRNLLDKNMPAVRASPIDSKTLNMKKIPEILYSKNQISVMREQYNNNEVVHVVIPVVLYDRNSYEKFIGDFNLFLQSLENKDTAFKFFARGPIILPDECRFFKGNCRAALIAKADDAVAAFLGDAENPAHTEWNPRALILEKNWDSPSKPLQLIRRSLQILFDLIAKPEESKDNDLLSEFFSLPSEPPDGKSEVGGPEKGGNVPNPPTSSIPVKDLGFEIVKLDSGFILTRDNYSNKRPDTILVEMAYNRIGGNALGHYSKLDFDLYDPSTIEVEATQATIRKVTSNVLELIVTGPDYRLNVTLKDLNRDLFVKASVTKWTM